MNKFKLTAGIIWALVSLLLMVILFFALGGFSQSLAKLPFMKLNPVCSGGEVARRIVADNCTLEIRQPVFNGFLGEKNRGFVQVDWRGIIPEMINDTIDYNMDNIPDFIIEIDRKENTSELSGMTPLVKNISVSAPTSYGWAARVKIINVN